MKRDMEKVRGVMLALEADTKPFFMIMNTPAIGGTAGAEETVEYILMLHSAGFLEKSQNSTYRLTWAGHEFLDSVRDPEIWHKTKEGASKVGSWSVKLLADMATGFIRHKAVELGLPIVG